MSDRGAATSLTASVLLLRLDARRAAAAFIRPLPGVWIGTVLPIVLVGGALWLAGEGARPDLAAADGAALWGFVIAAPLSFLGYGVLFRPADDSFLRHLGVAAGTLYLHRSLRLFGAGMAISGAALIPFVATGENIGRPAAISIAAAMLACGCTVLSLAYAARATVPEEGGGPGVLSRLIKYDRELQQAGPLFYAPLAPLFAGTAGGALVGNLAALSWISALVCSVAGVLLALLGFRPFARALPRFAPRAQEMAFAPPPAAEESGLVLNRGFARFLPRAVAAVRARDAAIVGRRFRWSSSIVWPVAIAAAVGLARWGDRPGVQVWVLLAGGVTLLVQAGAIISLGRLERSGTRWIDRLAGVRWVTRWLGRWAFGFGLSLWLVVPLSLMWTWWVEDSSGWGWVAAGMASAAVAASASTAAAGR